MTLEERAKQLKKIQSQLPGVLDGIAKDATIRAIEKAADMTPGTHDDLSGTNTRSAGMKQHWDTDSDKTPKRSGETLTTVLANNKNYASYVNDGHRMDRHFVPGLNVNPASGMLEMDPNGKGGIVVGTKTSYVPGLYMVDAAKKVYQETVESEAKTRIEKLFNE